MDHVKPHRTPTMEPTMSLSFFRPPRDLADAYRTLTDPGAHNCHPAVIQTTWQFLKEGRGHRFYPERLSLTAHLIEEPAPQASPAPAAVNQIDAARVAAIPLIRRIIGTRAPAPKGAA